MTAPLVEPVIAPLYGAYAVLAEARRKRGVLELDVPERRVRIDSHGLVAGIELRERLDSHKLIEEFMILANVAAAEVLEERKSPCMYRVHDQPSADKLEALRDFLETLGLSLRPGRMTRAQDFNAILAKVEGTAEARVVNEVVLRSQAQACYDPVNIGHFGLSLRRYCHFTSPIRRYADLLVHRALIEALKLGAGRSGGGAARLRPRRRTHLGDRAEGGGGRTRCRRSLYRRLPRGAGRYDPAGPDRRRHPVRPVRYSRRHRRRRLSAHLVPARRLLCS